MIHCFLLDRNLYLSFDLFQNRQCKVIFFFFRNKCKYFKCKSKIGLWPDYKHNYISGMIVPI